ncbi:PfkB family carbohydrate kinase [Rathayibacter sp. YIM 133350]|uniref:carbohydrate kinase family protein n=1 Tax=Rathayibacter sp. YIM 133350 TaxID=3131992 RepID=UPI00307DE7A3
MSEAPVTEAVLGVVGDSVEDIVVWLDEPLRPATDTASRVFRSRGGSGANVAALAGSLVPTRFIGSVGTDAAGDALETELTGHGVDVRVQRHGVTGAVVLLIDVVGERTMFPDRGASALLDHVDPGWLANLAHLHAPSYGLEREPMRSEILRMLAAVRAAGGSISLDASSTGLLNTIGLDEYAHLLERIAPDLLLANAAEAALVQSRVPAATTLVVKNGPQPTTVWRDGTRLAEVAVDPVESIRDLTGAGDAFAAGFLAARLAGTTLADACLRGHAVAASVLASPGATTR